MLPSTTTNHGRLTSEAVPNKECSTTRPSDNSPEVDCVNEKGLFYWMEDVTEGDIQLKASCIDIPKGCRFCIQA